MRIFSLVWSFRIRLLLLLAALLIATLSIQYYLNRRAGKEQSYLNQKAQEESDRVIAEQERALAAAFVMGVESISSGEWLVNLNEQAKHPLLDPNAGRITNILIVDSNGRVLDSLTQYNPIQKPDGTLDYFELSEVQLPPLINPIEFEGEPGRLPSTSTETLYPGAGEPRAFAFPVETDVKGRLYVIVALGSANPPSGILSRETARPLLYTLTVLLIMTLLTTLLVWRFTEPIKALSDAARRVAAGDLSFRVRAANRRDEIGALAARFNEMISKLARTRELESRLNQAERSAVVGRLASAIAHEVRNPLNYINLTLDHLRASFAPRDPSKQETFDRLATQLKAEVARIDSRITEFLKYSRPSRLNLQPVDLRSAAADAVRMVEVEAKENDIDIDIESTDNLPLVMADEEALRSVFTNLIINSLQAINGRGGAIRIRLTEDDGKGLARIEIADDGPGIPAGNISQVFEPYFSTKETGTGLGLAIVKKAVEDHGGSILVTSGSGEGTTFTITLPVSPD